MNEKKYVGKQYMWEKTRKINFRICIIGNGIRLGHSRYTLTNYKVANMYPERLTMD